MSLGFGLPSEERCLEPEELFIAELPRNWLNGATYRPCPSDNISFDCPYSLRKTSQFLFGDKLWTVGDIVSVSEPNNKAFAQIVELYINGFCEKKAQVIWLVPKPGVTDYNSFRPDDFAHIRSFDKRLVPIECLTFIMKIPINFDYTKYVGNKYLVDTNITSHASRFVAPELVAKTPPKQSNRGRGRGRGRRK